MKSDICANCGKSKGYHEMDRLRRCKKFKLSYNKHNINWCPECWEKSCECKVKNHRPQTLHLEGDSSLSKDMPEEKCHDKVVSPPSGIDYHNPDKDGVYPNGKELTKKQL